MEQGLNPDSRINALAPSDLTRVSWHPACWRKLAAFIMAFELVHMEMT